MDRTAPVFDYVFDTPWVLTDDVSQAMNDALESGESPSEAFSREMAARFRDDPDARERFREAFRSAGTNLVSVTLGSRVDPSTPLSEAIWLDLARWQTRFDAIDWLHKVSSPARARAIAERGDVGVVLNTQNLGGAVGGDVSLVDDLYSAGVRVMQLTYNRQNLLGTGCTDYSGGGLSATGREAVERINDLGGVVDLSHCNRETTLDAVEVSEDPVAYTHVGCSAVGEHDRNKSDAELRALAESDGYVGIVAIPSFLAPGRADPPFEVFFDHVEHAVDVVGADRVGIGTDFANLDVDVPEALLAEVRANATESLFREEHRAAAGLGEGFGPFRSYTDWPVIREGLEERFDDEAVRGILGENFVSFWERVESR